MRFAILILCATIFYSCSSDLKVANELYEEKKYSEVMDMLKGKTDEGSRILLANVYKDIGDFSRMLAILDTAKKNQPDTIQYLVAHALFENSTSSNQNYLEAIEILDRLIDNNPASKKYYIAKLKALNNLEEYREMLFLARQCLKLFPTDKEFNYLIGVSFYQVGDYSRAIKNIAMYVDDGEISSSDNDKLDALRFLGHAYEDLGNIAEAEGIFLEAYSIDKERESTLHAISSFYINQKDVETACRYLKEAIALGTDNTNIWQMSEDFCN